MPPNTAQNTCLSQKFLTTNAQSLLTKRTNYKKGVVKASHYLSVLPKRGACRMNPIPSTLSRATPCTDETESPVADMGEF